MAEAQVSTEKQEVAPPASKFFFVRDSLPSERDHNEIKYAPSVPEVGMPMHRKAVRHDLNDELKSEDEQVNPLA
jgi:hypothetical protein